VCWLPEPMLRAMLPLQPGAAPLGPPGVCATTMLPATWLWLGSLASENMNVQFSAIAAWPWEMIFTTSVSSDSAEAGFVVPSSMLFFMISSAVRPPPVLKAGLPLESRNWPS
jgi:hypothetical protein